MHQVHASAVRKGTARTANPVNVALKASQKALQKNLARFARRVSRPPGLPVSNTKSR